MLIGAKLPHTGAAAMQGVTTSARALEQAGFDSLWVSDHIVQPRSIASAYPFAADGRAAWSPDTPYLEAITVLAAAAAVTTTVALGTAALVLPQRNPILLAKQAASVDVMSGGRLCLGLGAGWLREEFAALGWDFDTRGARMSEWTDLLRSSWTGYPQESRGSHYHLPAGTLVLPKPTGTIPLYLGGHSKVALRRAGRLGDGWLAQQSMNSLNLDQLASEMASVAESAVAAGRASNDVPTVLRLVDSKGRLGEVARAIPKLAAIGIKEIIVDIEIDEHMANARQLLRDAAELA